MDQSLLSLIGEILLYAGAMVIVAWVIYSLIGSPSSQLRQQSPADQPKVRFERRSKERPDRRRNPHGKPPRGIERRKRARRKTDLPPPQSS